MNEKIQELLDGVQRTANQVGTAAADVAAGAGKKAQELLSSAKTRMRIVTLENNISEKLSEVGTLIYATHTGAPSDFQVLLEKLQEIDAIKAEIAALNESLCLPDNNNDSSHLAATVCPNCGTESQEGDQFCRICGRALR